MKRRKMNSKIDYFEFVKSHNNRTNVYTTVYDFEHFTETMPVEDSVIIDRIFLDFDAHDEPLQNAYDDLQKIVQTLVEEDTIFKMYFSGKGFHVFVYGEPVDDIRSIQQYYSKISDGIPTLDRTGIQTNRLRRIPNSMNLSSSDSNGNPYFCIPLLVDDLKLDLEDILVMAEKPRKVSSNNGSKLAVFPEMEAIEISEVEVDIPVPAGKLPILPCLHNAVMVENPSHYARVYLVQWYRDLLSMGERVLSTEQNDQIHTTIMQELESIASIEDVWLDWDSRTSSK